MGLFAPWFLAGLAGLALPLYLHLLRRHKQPPKPVPSLMFYEPRTISSTHHRRLDYIFLLSLRLLVLLLLILAFANPFINRDTAALASNRLVLIVIDNSFSMRAGTRLADAKDAAMSVLAGKGAARGQVAAFGSQLRLMTQPIEDQAHCVPPYRPFSPAMATVTSVNWRAPCEPWLNRSILPSSFICSATCSAASWRPLSATWLFPTTSGS